MGHKMAEHIVTKKQYAYVFAILLVLTAATTAIGMVDLGRLNVVVALLIATIKALLVVLFFMHIYWSNRLNKLAIVSGVAWFVLLLWLTLADFATRGWLPFGGK
jgi:cytochrome c oxidase subunit 4